MPVVEKMSRVLRTVETSIFKLVAIALCVHPRVCFCQTIRQRISSLYALDRRGSHDAIVTVCAQTFEYCACASPFPIRKWARTWKSTVSTLGNAAVVAENFPFC